MPKKQRKPKENLNEKKKILDELAESLKSAKKSGQEPGLEDNIELNTENFEFSDFMSADSGSAPVLERMAGRQAGPVFVGGISRTPSAASGEEKSSDEFKYMPGNNANGEPKYIDSDSHISAATERVDFAKVGRNFEPWKDINQDAMFTQSAEARTDSSAQERMWGAERFDVERERRKNPMEREEAKYDKYKPDLPKSR